MVSPMRCTERVCNGASTQRESLSIALGCSICGHIATIYSRLAARISAERAHKLPTLICRSLSLPPSPFRRLIRVTLRGAALRFGLLRIRWHRNLEHSTRAAVQQCDTVGNVHHCCLLSIVQLNKLCTVGRELFVLIEIWLFH